MKFLFIFGLLLLSTLSRAALINSAQSGPWGSASTWLGGVVPTDTDDVVIVSGHTVTVDIVAYAVHVGIQQGATLTFTNNANSASLAINTMTVNGHLNHNARYLVSSQIVFGSNASFTLSGNALMSFFRQTAPALPGIWLDLTTLPNANINVTGGTIEFNNEHQDVTQLMFKARGDLVFGLNNTVKFTGYNSIATDNINAELPILGNLETWEETCHFAGGKVGGQLTQLQIKGNFVARGRVYAWSTATEIILWGNCTFMGSDGTLYFPTLRFGSPAEAATNAQVIDKQSSGVLTANHLFINNSHASGVTFTGSQSFTKMDVLGTLTFQQGKLFLGSTITGIALVNPVVGASSSNYIVTPGTSKVQGPVNTTAYLFPVGTSTSYNPLSLRFSANVSFPTSVQVLDDNSLGTNALNKKWVITGHANYGYVANFQWNSDNENNGFDRSDSYVYHLTYSLNSSSNTAATGSNPYNLAVPGVITLYAYSAVALTVKSTPLAAPIVTAQSGPWNQTSTWLGGITPTQNTAAVILNGHTVTATGTTNARKLDINAGGTLTVNHPARTVISNGALTVDGTLTMNGGALWTDSANVHINGNLAVNPTGIINLAGQLDNCCFPERYSAKITAVGRNSAGLANVAAATPIVQIKSGAQINAVHGQFIVYKHSTDPANTTTFESEAALPSTSSVHLTTHDYFSTQPIIARAGSYGHIVLNSYRDNIHFESSAGQILIKGHVTGQPVFNTFIAPNQEVTLLGDISLASDRALILGTGSTFRFGSAAYTPAAKQTITLEALNGTIFVDNPHGLEGNLTVNQLQLVRGKITGTATANAISGFDNTRYVVGSVALNAVPGSTNTLFPVGTQGDYLPITLNNPDGPSNLSAGISPSNNFTPTPSPGLTLEYQLRKTAGGSGIPTATVRWTGAYEKVGFTRNSIKRHYLVTGAGFPYWQSFGSDLAASGSNPYQLTFLMDAPNSFDRYSFGNGAPPPPCPTTLTPTGTITTNQKASSTVITVSGSVNTIASGSTVIYQAGNYVQLNPGFRANSEAVFTAQILAGCQ